jgi:hypothetical protein
MRRTAQPAHPRPLHPRPERQDRPDQAREDRPDHRQRRPRRHRPHHLAAPHRTVAANELRAKELQIQQTKLALEQQKALDKANKDAQKTQTAAQKTRQAKVDACVNDNKDLIEHRLGTTLSSVIDDCQKQYPDTVAGADMQEAASTSSSGSSGSQNLLIGAGAVLAGGLWIGARKVTRPQPVQPAYHPHYPPQ